MALTDVQFRAALRIGDAPEEVAQATRIRTYVYTAIDRHVNFVTIPDEVRDEAAVRLGGYLYDQPHVGRAGSFANSLRSSGAAFILAPYVTHRLGIAEGEAEPAAPAPAEPAVVSVTGVDIVSGELLVTFSDGTSTATPLPVPPTPTIDLTAITVQSRGAELARSGTLPTAADSNDIATTFTVGSVAGVTGVGNTLRVPLLRPSPETIGIWAVALVNDVEVDEVLIPWGGGGIEEESNSRNEYSYHGLSFASTSSQDNYIDVLFAGKRGAFGTMTLYGDSDTLPANSVVVFYLAVGVLEVV